jgi:DNA (cytosine-5)-methyltransferase 1
MMDHTKMTLGSLFDGSGGFPLGGILAGIEPKWSSEIEPFPVLVTHKRLPGVRHYGDVSSLSGAELPPVDIITFGSPCQDLSIAGKRAGIHDGDRSNLFFQAIRIIKEMRDATNGRYPRYCVWENVPGAFSSHGGDDFKAVLEAVIGIKEEGIEVPSPENHRWPKSDVYLGNGWSVAYRVFDAQYWGVPQRRARIYLVADLAGGSAGEVLFKSEGVSGYTPQGFRSWQGAAGAAEEGAHPTGRLCLNDQGGQFMDVSEDVSGTLRSQMDGHPPVVLENLDAIAVENHPTDSRVTVSEDGKVQTLTSRMGTGGNNVPLVLKIRCGCEGGGKGPLIQTDKSATLATNNDQTLFVPTVFGICAKDSNAMKSGNPNSGFYEAETTRTLDANGGSPVCNQGGMAVVAVQGSMIGRADKNGPQGSGVNEDISFTLDATDRHAVAHPVYSTSKSSFHLLAEEDVVNTLVATDYKDPPIVAEEPYYIVRRLTPTECARLQGFPDWWCACLGTEEPTEQDIEFWREVFETHRRVTGSAAKPKSDAQLVKWLKDPHADSAEYKLWGNGVALPCVCFVLAGIVYYDQSEG